MDGWDFYWDLIFEKTEETDDSYNYKEELEKEKYYEAKQNK